MDKLIKNQTSFEIVFSKAETEIAKQLFHANQLIHPSFKISDAEIMNWTKSIIELVPNVTPEKIKEVIDRFKTNEIEWNHNQGVQNIIRLIKTKRYYY